MPIKPIDMSDLVAVPPIESLSLCALFRQIPPQDEVRPTCSPGDAAGSTAYFDVNGALYPLTAMTMKEYSSLYGAMHGQKPADASVDLESDSAGRGLQSPTQTVAMRLAEKLSASNPKAPDAVVNLLAVRGYAWLVAQVVRRIADSRTEGSFSQALANLGQAGFKTPAGWLSTLFLSHPTYKADEEHAVSISSVALAYQVALHGLMHDEKAGTLVRQTDVPMDPLPAPVKVGMTTDQMGGDDMMAVQIPSGGGPDYQLSLFGSKQLVPLLSASSAIVGSVIAKSLQSLSTALAVILAPGYTAEDAPTHTCPDGTIWDPQANACVPKMRRPTRINPSAATPAPAPAAPAPASPAPDAPAPEPKGLPWAWIGLGAAAVAAVGAGIYAMTRKKDDPVVSPDEKVALGITGRADNPTKTALGDTANLLSNGLVEVGQLTEDHGDEPREDAPVLIYRFDVPQLKLEKGEARTYLVPASYDKATYPHPLPQYEEWFAKDLRKVAKTIGVDHAELVRMLMSKDIAERAQAYIDIGNYHGFQNLDGSPWSVPYKKAKTIFRNL